MLGLRTPESAAPEKPVVEIRELVAALLIIHLTANAGLISRAVGSRWVVMIFGGCALIVYTGATSGRLFAARRAVGWVNAPWREWLAAPATGWVLSLIVTVATIAFGHSTQVTEPVHTQVLAVTLGPILEEICLRGVLVPLLARIVGPSVSVVIAAAVFSLLHLPASILKLASIGITGTTYGWIRIRTGSTAVAALAHAAYNLSILLYGLAR